MDALRQVRLDDIRAAWTMVPTLMVLAAVLLAWFPGHNAARWGHGHVPLVRASGWFVVLLGGLAVVLGAWDRAFPALMLLWLGVAVWSYGKWRTHVAAASPRRAFEVVRQPVRALPFVEDGAAVAIAA